MIFHFILNPKSGRSPKQKKMEQEIKDACAKRQLSYHIYYTTCQGDATTYVNDMIKLSQERQRFICVGGDGTINEIANTAPCNPNIEFGVIPNGSGNDFVRNFTNTDLFTSIDAQIDGQPEAIDLIKCNDFYCVNMINIGFDCAVVKEAAKLKKMKIATPGMSYIMGVAVTLFKPFGTQMKIIFDDGEILDKKFTLTAIGNGRFCGGGFMAAPVAYLQDGLLDICAIDKISRLTFIKLVKSYKEGTYLQNESAMKFIKHRQVSHFKMEFPDPLPVCNDGEIVGAKTLDFTVIPKALNFVVPKGCELRYPYTEDAKS